MKSLRDMLSSHMRNTGAYFARISTGGFRGHLDSVGPEILSGWIINKQSPATKVFLKLKIGNSEVRHSVDLARPDVAMLIPDAADSGFRVGLPRRGSARLLRIYVSVNAGGPYRLVKLALLPRNVKKRKSSSPSRYIRQPSTIASQNYRCFLSGIAELKHTLDPERSVVVVVWDCGHNPVGRAVCVAQAIAAGGRSAVIVAYQFEEFGTDVWEPVRAMGQRILRIPWSERSKYLTGLHQLRGHFKTLVICKDRYPSLELAAALLADDTRVILDLDDNEDAFVENSVHSKNRAYGLTSRALAAHLTRSITVKTAASVTLKEARGASALLRHCRAPNEAIRSKRAMRSLVNENEIRACFFGTVRQHKNIIGLARMVRALGPDIGGKKLVLTVGGDIPSEIADELSLLGVNVSGRVPLAELPSTLAWHDILITGFPSESADRKITDYQISSKIGDALSVGMPCLTPLSPSTADLTGIEGIHLFTEATFVSEFYKAISVRRPCELPEDFTLEGGYEAFAHVEALCEQNSCTGKTLMSAPAWISLPSSPNSSLDIEENIVLVWKQFDAGIYGRRIDQISRALSSGGNRKKVYVLEFVPEWDSDMLEKDDNFTSDAQIKLTYLRKKSAEFGVRQDGCTYKSFIYTSVEQLQTEFGEFLLTSNLTAHNSSFVFFPIIRELIFLWPQIQDYPHAVDVVDNQSAWATSEEMVRRNEDQLRLLLKNSKFVVTNNSANRRYLEETFGPELNVHQIANWYAPPRGVNKCLRAPPLCDDRCAILVYSGNLNDRFDWDLVEELMTSLMGEAELRLIGSVREASQEKLQKLLELENVCFYGPRDEASALQLIETADIGIVPHQHNSVSMYMDPIKVEMFASAGLAVLSTAVAGVTQKPGLKLCNTAGEFRAAILELRVGLVQQQPEMSHCLSNREKYLELMKLLRPSLSR